MCGLVGIYTPSGSRSTLVSVAIKQMTSTLVHRGPDNEGYWIDSDGLLALGHRRLAVIDLAASGDQPMHSPTGRFILVFNGEIYNHTEIRAELKTNGMAPNWRGTSDTETLAAAIEVWGLQQAIEKVSGMFACAIWDRNNRVLTLIRDRMGEKPLYYGWCGDTFVFASELRAIERLPGVTLKLDSEAIEQYLRFTYVPGPQSIYTGIMKLPPGYLATVRPEPGLPPILNQYWSLLDCARAGLAKPFAGDDREALTELERLLERSVRRQIFADVPVGAFLSGGVDSACVVSEMVRHTSKQISTYTLGFDQFGYDETEQARLVAEKLGTTHHQIVITEEEAMRVVPDLGFLYDEPFADSSQIPTVLISRFAREGVTVALTGDGGDEVFGGYPRHSSAALWHRRVKRYPPALRRSIGTSLRYLLNIVGNLKLDLTPALNDSVRKFSKTATVLYSHTLAERYMEWVTHWRPADLIFQENKKHANRTNEAFVRNTELNDVDRELMLIDSLTYLVDEMLVKVDRAAMSASLETRAPFLDHELVEFAWTLPKRLIINGAERKGLLRKLVEKRIAPITLKSLKSGFSVPLGSWLRGGLRDWAEAMLEAHPTAADCLNDYVIKRVWRNHMRGNEDNSSLLWAVLMFKSWASHRML